MWKIYVDNSLFASSQNPELSLINPTINLKINTCGSLQFTMAPTHPYYDKISLKKSIIDVYRDDDLLFQGIAVSKNNDFYNQATYYCEGELTYLNDSILRPKSYTGYTVQSLLADYINQHNAQVDTYKQFTLGTVEFTDSITGTLYTNMESTFSYIQSNLIDEFGGYIRIRYEDDVKYIDYLKNNPRTSSQVIELTKNLIDYTSDLDTSDFATRIIPLGPTQDEGTEVDGLQTRMNIKSVNNNIDYLQSDTAVSNYGIIEKTVEWSNVTTPAELLAKGQQFLTDLQFDGVTIEVNAIDLSYIRDIDRFQLLDSIRIVSVPHGMDRYFTLSELTINLNNPENDTVVLGNEENEYSFTALMEKAQNEQAANTEESVSVVSSEVDDVEEDIEEIDETVGELQISLKKTSDGLEAEVSRATSEEESISSRVEMTESGITSIVSQKAKIWNTTRNIKYSGEGAPTITNPSENDYYLDVTTGQIYTYVQNAWRLLTETATDVIGTIQSDISQTESEIELKVDSTDFNGNNIVGKINLSATTATIEAGKIDLDGYVTVTDLETSGSTTINGDNITTGTISADRLLVSQVKTSDGAYTVLATGAGVNGYGYAYHTWTFNYDVYMPQVYKNTSTSDANMHISDTGYLNRSSGSSKRWKHDIADITDASLLAEKLYDVKPRQFVFNDDYLSDDDERKGKTVVGFIAEEIEEAYPIACEHDEDGLASNWGVRYIVPPMLQLIQDQHKEIENLKARVEALEKGD